MPIGKSAYSGTSKVQTKRSKNQVSPIRSQPTPNQTKRTWGASGMAKSSMPPSNRNASNISKNSVPSSNYGQRWSAQKPPSSGSKTTMSAKQPSQNVTATKQFSQNQKPPEKRGMFSSLTSGISQAVGDWTNKKSNNPVGQAIAKNPVSASPVSLEKEKKKGFFGNLADKIGSMGSNIKNGFGETVSNVLESGKEGLKNIIGTGSNIAENAKGALGALLEKGKEGIHSLMSKGAQVMEGTKELLTNALETGKEGVKSILNMGGSAVEGLKELAGKVINSDEVQALIDKGGQIAEGAKELFSGLLEKGKEKLEPYAQGAKDFVWNAVGSVMEGGARAVSTIQKGFNSIKEQLPESWQAKIDEGLLKLGEGGNYALEKLGKVVNPAIHACVAAANAIGIDTAAIGAYMLDMEEIPKGSGIYHARTDAGQSKAGYNILYDLGFAVGTDIETPERLEFTVGDKDYVFWGWKADYLNLGAGAELGIYERMEDTDHWLVDPESLVLPMTLDMTANDGTILDSYHPEENQWWITSFNSKMPMHPDDYSAEFTVDLSGDEEMRKAVEEAVAQREQQCKEEGIESKWSMSEDKDGNPILVLKM